MMIKKDKEYENKKEDFLYCEKVIKKHSKTFYQAFSQLSRHKALSIFAVYAFCRRADDLIDEYSDVEGLDKFEQELRDFESGLVADKPEWRALEYVFKHFTMDIKPFYEMIQGQRKDISFTQPRNQDDLEEYCYYVASTVGLMILPILSDKASEIQEEAKLLGKAMQITNILRDIGEDSEKGRIYIPKTIMEEFGINELDIDAELVDQAFINMWEYQAKIAERYYEESLKMTEKIDSDCRKAFLVAAYFYRDILNAVRKGDYQVFGKRHSVSKLRKVELLGQVKKELDKY